MQKKAAAKEEEEASLVRSPPSAVGGREKGGGGGDSFGSVGEGLGFVKKIGREGEGKAGGVVGTERKANGFPHFFRLSSVDFSLDFFDLAFASRTH